VFFGVFVAEEVDGIGDKESGDTTMVDVHTYMYTPLGLFEHVPVTLMKLFSGKKNTFWA